jgi:hypothetical protein
MRYDFREFVGIATETIIPYTWFGKQLDALGGFLWKK